MSMLWKYVSGALLIALVIALFAGLSFRTSAAVSAAGRVAAEQRADGLAQDLKQSEAARAHEHAEALRFQSIADQFEQDKIDAESHASQLAADLRAERVRLRPVWRCPAGSVPSVAASASKPDAAANGCAGVAVDLFRAVDPIVQRQDAQIRGLQAILTAERKP